MTIDRAQGVRVGGSGIDGHGVFATRDFQLGKTVLLLDDSRVVDDKHPLDAAAGELAHHCDYLAGGRVVLMPSPERYINSSCEPNTCVATRDGVRHVVVLTVIAAGDEVTYDYLINCHGGVRVALERREHIPHRIWRINQNVRIHHEQDPCGTRR